MSQQDVTEVSQEPTLVEEFQGVTAAACGSNHSAFVVDGQLYTYGSNKYDQLGREVGEGASSGIGAAPAPVLLEMEEGQRLGIQQVALGAFHSAAVTEDGALWTWGWGGSFWHGAGALGHGTRVTAASPTLVNMFLEKGEKIRQVVCGLQHTLVLTSEGRLFTTGKGDFGRLGRGDTHDELEFVEIDYFLQSDDSVLHPGEPTTITKVGAGSNFSAAMSEQGELWVWGRNDYGQLGLGEEAMGDMYSAERFPRLVRNLAVESHHVIDFACGEHHIVALTKEGDIFEWGDRKWLEPHHVSLPSQYRESLKGIVKVEAGGKYSFALTGDGSLYVWGQKASGCLAQGKECPKTLVEPTPVSPAMFGHQRVIDIVASKSRCLAITHEGEFVA